MYSYDLSALPLEYVEMLPRFIPNEMELKAFKNYEKSGKSFDDLTAEDKFMWLVREILLLTETIAAMRESPLPFTCSGMCCIMEMCFLVAPSLRFK